MVSVHSDTVAYGRRPSEVSARSSFVEVGPWPFALLLAYVTIEYVRPQEFLPAIGLLRPGLVLALGLMFWWVRHSGLKELYRDPLILRFGLLVFLALAWVPFAANNYFAYTRSTYWLLVLFASTIPISLIFAPRARRWVFVKFWIAIHAYLAVYSITHAGRGPGSFLRDENDICLALGMGLPFVFFLAQQSGTRTSVRVLYYGLAVLILIGMVWTNSRGGFIGLVAVSLYMLWLSKNKIRNLIIAAILGACAYTFVPSSYVDEVQSISTEDDGGRLLVWRIGVAMFADNPIFGVGTANFAWRINDYQVTLSDYEPGDKMWGGRAAHSLYFTLLPEYGAVGGFLFFSVVFGMMRRLRRSELMLRAAAASGDREAERDALLANAINASIIGYLSAGTFLSVLYYPPIWYALGFVVALSRDVESRYGAHAPEGGLKKPGSSEIAA